MTSPGTHAPFPDAPMVGLDDAQLDASVDCFLFTKDRQGRYTFANAAVARLFDCPVASILGRDDAAFFDLARSQDLIRADRQVMESGNALVGREYLSLTGQQELRQFLVTKTPLRGPGGEVTGLLGVGIDVTDGTESDHQLQDLEAKFEALSERSLVGIYIIEGGKFTYVNPKMAEILGRPAEAIIGRLGPIEVAHPDDRERVRANLREREQGNIDAVHYQGKMLRGDGALRFVEIYGSAVQLRQGKAIIGTMLDITERLQQQHEMERRAHYDGLTRLPNRSLFEQRLNEAIERVDKGGEGFSLLFLDVDHFKQVNDTLGHRAGDELLVQVANRLGNLLMPGDTLARFGGDEFLLLKAQALDEQSLAAYAQALLATLTPPIWLGAQGYNVSASVGLARYPEDAGNGDDLLKHADLALYAAKHEGRNRARFFVESMGEANRRHLQMRQALGRAIERQEFELHYQPIMDLKHNTLCGAEGLLRWHHPERGLLYPDQFIDVAEASGLIADIDCQSLRMGAQQTRYWRDTGFPAVRISVNTSPYCWNSEGMKASHILDTIAETGLPADAVNLEITETLMLTHTPAIKATMEHLRSAGVTIALDDFGTGYSSLAYLEKLELDLLKIDRRFVQDLKPGSPKDVVCRAVIQMAHGLGLKVVAEGIETPEQLALLRQAGCDYGQGFLFGKPMPAAEFEAHLPRALAWLA